jgi:TolB-like protein
MEIIDKLYFIVAVVVIAACVRCPNEAYNVSNGISHEPAPASIADARDEAAATTAKSRVAVLDFRSTKADIDEQKLLLLTDYAREAMFRSGAFDVITEENAEVILAGYGRQLEECTASCEIEFGTMLGADYVLTGRLTKFGDYVFVTMKAHETTNARLAGAVSYKSSGVLDARQDLEPHIVELTRQIKDL